MTGTKYACNERNDWNQINLQSWSPKGLNMLAIIEILFSRDSSRKHSHRDSGTIFDIASIFEPYWKILQEFGFEVASTLSPFGDQGSMHIWSKLILSLQAYLVYVIKIIANIRGLSLYHTGKFPKDIELCLIWPYQSVLICQYSNAYPQQ